MQGTRLAPDVRRKVENNYKNENWSPNVSESWPDTERSAQETICYSRDEHDEPKCVQDMR